jgi:hypothetical protein
MSVDDIQNVDTFDMQERYHIKTLSLRKDDLNEMRKRNKGKLEPNKDDELRALKWVFSLLEEISREPDG